MTIGTALSRMGMTKIAVGGVCLCMLQGPLALSAKGHPSGHNKIAADPVASRQRLILIVMDYQSLLCNGCQQAVIDLFYDLKILQHPPEKTSIVGLLRMSPDPDSLASRLDLRIARRKLSAFKEFNQIDVPILIDFEGLLGGALAGRNLVILLDPDAGVLRSWSIPLSQAALQQMHEILTEAQQ